MRILVIGGSGFIGTALVKKLRTSHDCFILSREASTDEKWIEGDIVKGNFSVQGFDYVYHLAALKDGSVEMLEKTNVLGSINVFADCLRYNVPIFYTSTASIERRNFTPYIISKKHAEDWARYYCNLGLDITIGRLGTVLGDFPEKGKVISDIIEGLKNNPEKIYLRGNALDIEYFVYLDDAIDAFSYIIEKGEIGIPYEIISEQIYIKDLVYMIATIMNCKYPIISEKLRQRFLSPPANLQSVRNLGWKSKHTIEDVIRKYV